MVLLTDPYIKDRKSGPCKTAVEDARLTANAFHRGTEFITEMTQVETAQIPQLDAFELLPEAAVRIERRGIRRQTLQVEAWRGTVREELLNGVAAVHGWTIPDNHHPAGHLAQQVLPKGHHILRIHGVVLAGEIPLALRRDRTDGGEVVAGPPFPQDQRVPHGGIGAHDTRQGIKARLIDEEDALLLVLRPFLIVCQISSRQRTIAASSRCRARRAGFWRLQRRALHKRPMWVRWKETPNERRITAAMRPRVQSSPRKP
jgi:hypothetical protein